MARVKPIVMYTMDVIFEGELYDLHAEPDWTIEQLFKELDARAYHERIMNMKPAGNPPAEDRDCVIHRFVRLKESGLTGSITSANVEERRRVLEDAARPLAPEGEMRLLEEMVHLGIAGRDSRGQEL